MPRWKLTVAYDGTDFCGWQKQFPHERSVLSSAPRLAPPSEEECPTRGAEATVSTDQPPSGDEPSAGEDRARVELRTVQSVLERAVRFVVREPVMLQGASRTDSGVHARGQVAAFTTQERDAATGWPVARGGENLVRALNSRLPRDVLVLDAEAVGEGFDPIRGAVSKSYSYGIWCSRERPLWERRTTLHVWHELDAARMDAAARLFEGEHDFAGFAAAGHGRATTVRTVHSCRVHAEMVEGGLTPAYAPAKRMKIEISGNGFLWNMVRIIGGTLVEVGKGRLSEENVRRALESGDRREAGPTLPPEGLCLEWIRYT